MDRPRVLLADDHQTILECVSRHLAEEFEIVAAVLDGEAAITAVLALKPDAVVLDISMPRMSGLEAARRMSALPNPPRVVFLTVHDDPDFKDAADGVGASGYVLKQHMSTLLVAALHELPVVLVAVKTGF
jgi:DNA-binding NarL/FixJ family response regulator